MNNASVLWHLARSVVNPYQAGEQLPVVIETTGERTKWLVRVSQGDISVVVKVSDWANAVGEAWTRPLAVVAGWGPGPVETAATRTLATPLAIARAGRVAEECKESVHVGDVELLKFPGFEREWFAFDHRSGHGHHLPVGTTRETAVQWANDYQQEELS